MLTSLLLLLFFILIIDLYGYYGLRKLTGTGAFRPYRRGVIKGYWMINILFVVFSVIWALAIRNSDWELHVQYRNYLYISGAFMLIFLPKLVFLVFVVLNDLKNIVAWIVKLFMPSRRGRGRKLAAFRRSLLLPAFGALFSVIMFIWVAHGIFYQRFNFQVERVEVFFDDLPQGFDGYRLVHFSDTHLGSFARTRPVARGLEKISGLQPNLVIFSGDMVNNEAAEILPFISYFRDIQAEDGKFTVLGNHDMGDYRRWHTIEEKDINQRQLEEYKDQMGFSLLRNEHVFISNGQDSIMLVGVDNWGLPPFAQYGDLQQAMGQNADFPFKILISHDPTHWRAEVLPYTNIRLMLAGHTHAMQMGIRTRWFSWSPSSWMYPEWNGKYRQDQQVLYVNRGFGFLGFPGRLGMPPEITLITLRRSPQPES